MAYEQEQFVSAAEADTIELELKLEKKEEADDRVYLVYFAEATYYYKYSDTESGFGTTIQIIIDSESFDVCDFYVGNNSIDIQLRGENCELSLDKVSWEDEQTSEELLSGLADIIETTPELSGSATANSDYLVLPSDGEYIHISDMIDEDIFGDSSFIPVAMDNGFIYESSIGFDAPHQIAALDKTSDFECSSVMQFDLDIMWTQNNSIAYSEYCVEFPCYYLQNGNLEMNVIVGNGEEPFKTILTQETVSPFICVSWLNNSEIVFSVYDSNANDNIYKYNFNDNSAELIYTNSSDEWIGRIAAYNNEIYLLCNKYNQENDAIIWAVRTISEEGEELNYEILNIPEYSAADTTSFQITVTENYYLIMWGECSDDYDDFIVIDRRTGKIVSNFDGKSLPSTRLTDSIIDERYIIFQTQPDNGDYSQGIYSSDICVFDIVTAEFHFLKTSVRDEYEVNRIIADENGDVAFVVKNDSDEYDMVLFTDIISYII